MRESDDIPNEEYGSILGFISHVASWDISGSAKIDTEIADVAYDANADVTKRLWNRYFTLLVTWLYLRCFIGVMTGFLRFMTDEAW